MIDVAAHGTKQTCRDQPLLINVSIYEYTA